DLLIQSDAGQVFPFALRILQPNVATEVVKTKIFNRTHGPGQTTQVSLDLGETRIEHNEVEIQLPGNDFRRQILVEGSDDSETWSKVAEQNLLRFQVGDQKLVDLTVHYPPSRFRYLRLTLSPDPKVDDKPVEFGEITVRRRVQLPGEFTSRVAPFGERQAVRADGGPGSAWIIDLGGRDVPCSRLRVDIGDVEFVRDWHLEAGGPPESRIEFRRITRGTWRRRAGEPIEPMTAVFDEVKAARLRLVVTDHRNPPLDLQQIHAEAAAREVVFSLEDVTGDAVRLYFGNPKAEAPNYDFARNLPPRLDPPPQRLILGPRLANPLFVPEPLPLTERWPWLIYVLLGLAVAVLGALILNLARVAIQMHDDKQPEPQSA
ncbi:MAG: DUF3999 domain-containing protein, partial [Planctomycetes bacterium]|nr:DUF3999 domain-containing protein [Planctomycetota bacterium]